MSLSRAIFLFLHLLTLWVGGALGAQSTQLFFKQFTTDDGLPSSETYVSLVDRNGLLWVGTDNGVASFDGYEFTVYDADDGLTDPVVFTLQEDADGRIWAGTASGRVFYFENGTFNPFSRNDELFKLRKDNSLIHLLDVLSTGELVLKVNKKGILKISDQGHAQWLTNDERPTVYVYVPESNQDLITKQ